MATVTQASANYRAKRLHSAGSNLRSAANDLADAGMSVTAASFDHARAGIRESFKLDATYGGWTAEQIADALEEM